MAGPQCHAAAVTAVESLEAALACLSSSISAGTYDCVVLEHSLLADVPEHALFRAARSGEAPVVLMSGGFGKTDSQAADCPLIL